MSGKTDLEQISDWKSTIRGLSLEIEASRKHHSSSTDFILDVLKDLMAAVNQLERKLK